MMERNVHNKTTRIIHLAFLLPRDPVENVPYSTPSAPGLSGLLFASETRRWPNTTTPFRVRVLGQLELLDK